MTKSSIWLPVLFAMMLGITGCGDDGGGGGTGGSGTGGSGTGGSGATGGSVGGGDACATICGSRCSGQVNGLPSGDVAACTNECRQAGIFDGCDSEASTLIGCLEANDCGESGSTVCTDEIIDFGLCLNI